MLDDLETGVDRTDNKLSDAMRRMKKFIRQTEGSFGGSISTRTNPRWFLCRDEVRVVYHYPGDNTVGFTYGCYTGMSGRVMADGFCVYALRHTSVAVLKINFN